MELSTRNAAHLTLRTITMLQKAKLHRLGFCCVDFITNCAHLVGMLHVVVLVHRRNYRKSKIGFSKHAAIVRGIPWPAGLKHPASQDGSQPEPARRFAVLAFEKAN